MISNEPDETSSAAIIKESEQQTSASLQTEATTTSKIKTDENISAIIPSNIEVYEGLHITGTVIEVDIDSYRLKITGAVKNLLEFSFDDIKGLPSAREYVELECPNIFIDKGYWTGVKVLDLLTMAGIDDNAKRVKFTSIDKSYTQILFLEEIKPDGFLIAYQFNDKEFSKYHGYPLRLVAKDLAGSIWVKWLGEIEVLND